MENISVIWQTQQLFAIIFQGLDIGNIYLRHKIFRYLYPAFHYIKNISTTNGLD